MVATIGTRLLKMQHNDVMTDVTFVVKGTEIKAHRAVVSSHGGVLQDLLEKHDQRVEITEDLAPNTFKTVLEYLYTDGCEVNDANLFELTYAAKSLQLEELESFCSKFVEKKLTASNVVGFVEQALQFDSTDGLKVCQDYFRKNTESILKTKEFLEVSNEVLVQLCSSEGINCSELDLFSACVKWAKNNCLQKNLAGTPEELREALGAALQKIRFPCMTMQQFLKEVVPMEILNFDEVGQVVVGLEKNEQKANFSDVRRVENVQVTVKGHAAMNGSTRQLPASTTIMELKGMKLWNKGKGYNGSLYTLSHRGKELADEVTLASIYSPGEELVLEVHSISLKVKHQANGWNILWNIPCTLKISDIQNAERHLKGYIYAVKGLEPKDLSLRCYYDNKYGTFSPWFLMPGSTVLA